MKGGLNSTHLSCVAQQCKLQVWGKYVRILVSSFHANSYLGLGTVFVLASCSTKKKKKIKEKRKRK
jgi:hypothetical protein